MNIDMYKSEEIDLIIELLEHVQDGLEVEDPDILHMLIEEVIEILVDER